MGEKGYWGGRRTSERTKTIKKSVSRGKGMAKMGVQPGGAQGKEILEVKKRGRMRLRGFWASPGLTRLMKDRRGGRRSETLPSATVPKGR